MDVGDRPEDVQGEKAPPTQTAPAHDVPDPDEDDLDDLDGITTYHAWSTMFSC